MQKFPWKITGISCGVLTLLVIARCLVTVGRTLYYGGTNWAYQFLQDPWFYVGMAAAAICVVCFTMLAILEKKKDGRQG